MKISHSVFIRFALITLALSVAAGAMGSHMMKKLLSANELEVWEIAVRYALIHGLGVLVLAVNHRHFNERLTLGLLLLSIGTIIFSGSLFAYSTRELWGSSETKTMAAFAPVGGVAMIAGWLFTGIFGLGALDTEKQEKRKTPRSRKTEKEEL